MITFAVPWLFWASIAASLVAVAWHLLSVRQPPDLLLPTARFVPPTTARAVARQPRPSDLLLLALRVLALLCIGLALSGARCYGDRSRHAHLILVDGALPDSVVASDSVRWLSSAGDTSVQWRRVSGVATDPGVAIVRAFREVPSVLQDLPRVETLALTVLTGPHVAERRVWDAWRSRWPGHITLATAGARDTDSALTPTVAVEFSNATPDDPVMAAMRLAYPSTSRAQQAGRKVHIDRGDSATARTALVDGVSVQVHWPVSGLPSGWLRTANADTAGAVSAQGQTLIGPFVRVSSAPVVVPASSDTDSARWRTVAWWNDGTPAAIARRGAEFCEVQVSVVVSPGSDLLLSPHARGMLDAVVRTCEATTLPTASLASVEAGDSSVNRPAEVRTLRAITDPSAIPVRSVWTLVLLAVAIGALLLEWRLRT
ncbi:MAG: BatA domain-containing protein [Gemmatimonadaceae bacterium]|nr:BatA domain-containing protein [Gemmatimonadaceae bacterium]